MRSNFHPIPLLPELCAAGALSFCCAIILNVGGLAGGAKQESARSNTQQLVVSSVAWQQLADDTQPERETLVQASSTPELVETRTLVAQPPATIEGVWVPDVGTCSIRHFREGMLATIINMEGAWAGDTFCVFKNRQQTETGWRVVAHCSKPGEQWTTHVRLTMKGDRLIWTSRRGTQAYTRCSPDFLLAEAR